MKLIKTILLYITVTAIVTGCKKDNNGPDTDACNLPVFKAASMASFTRPCGIAISPSGLIAINTYNGFEEYGGTYGALGMTRVWRNYSDLLTKAAPIAEWSNRGAEALAFDSKDNLCVAETEQVAGIAVYKKRVEGSNVYFDYVRTISGGFVNPRGLAFDSKDRLFVANDGVGNVVRINDPINSADKQAIAAGFGSVKGLAVYNDVLYTTNFNDHTLVKQSLTAEGNYGTITGVAENISNPVDITVRDGLIVVSSPISGKVTILQDNQFNGPSLRYDGCTKELEIGPNIFGLALFATPSRGTALFVSDLKENTVRYYQQ